MNANDKLVFLCLYMIRLRRAIVSLHYKWFIDIVTFQTCNFSNL